MPLDPRDYKLDIQGVDAPMPSADAPRRPFLSVLFNCCSVYARVYRTPDAKAYRGQCPKCRRTVSFAVGEGGTDARAFVVE